MTITSIAWPIAWVCFMSAAPADCSSCVLLFIAGSAFCCCLNPTQTLKYPVQSSQTVALPDT